MPNYDPYNALWLSYSSISDFVKCPRAYYLKNVYKDSNTGNKISLIKPSLALGQCIHQILENISSLPKDSRFNKSLQQRLDLAWEKIKGKKGGFLNADIEHKYKRRAQDVLERVYKNPGPLKKLAVKIKDDLPHFWLSKQENIILCGKLDWLEYLPKEDAVHIIDFKTGHTRNQNSLQLPIYCLLASKCQKRKILQVSFWYLESDNQPVSQSMPNLVQTKKQVLDIAKKIFLARKLNKFNCPKGESGCQACKPFERILNGEGELVGKDLYGADLYILPPKEIDKSESIIL